MTSPANPALSARYRNAFGGVWRLTSRTFLVPSQAFSFLGLVAFVGVLAFTVARRERLDSYYDWASSFYILFLAPTLAFIFSGGSLRDDLKSTTTDYVYTRPLPRALYVIFKFISYVFVLQLCHALVLGCILAIGVLKGMPEMLGLAPRLYLGQMSLILAASGFGFLFGALTGRYVALGLAYAALVEVGIGQIPTQIGLISMLRQGRSIVGTTLDTATSGTAEAAAAAGVLVLFAVLTVGIAAALVHTREFTGDRAKES